MEVGKLSVEFRSHTGKAINRRLRAQKKIPAICYGGGADPLTLAMDPALLMKALDPVKKTNTVLALEVKDAPGGTQTLNVMVRDYQRDAVRGDLIHVDFIRVQLDQDVHAEVPIVLTGKCEGVKNGGILHQVIRMLEIACTPDKIPAQIEVDVTTLNLGEAIHVSDLKLAAGIRPLADVNSTICSVTAPRAEKAAEAAPVEGAAPAEGAAAAGAEKAAAAGGEKGAAKAPAAKEGEKKGK
jgi:large subunit ribosomal protein L25